MWRVHLRIYPGSLPKEGKVISFSINPLDLTQAIKQEKSQIICMQLPWSLSQGQERLYKHQVYLNYYLKTRKQLIFVVVALSNFSKTHLHSTL